MIRFIISLLVLAAGIGLLIMAGTVLLPVVAVFIIICVIAALFAPGRRIVPPEPQSEPPTEEIPASQSVIDVEAVEVSDDEPTGKN